MTEPPGGWPDASRPGVPLNPERDGVHWAQGRTTGVAIPRRWHADLRRWELLDGELAPAEHIATRWTYLGPCLLPAEVAAQVAAAERRGIERAAVFLDGLGAEARECGAAEAADELDEHAAAIRALLTEARDGATPRTRSPAMSESGEQ